MPPVTCLLVANRGEIARRVIRTAAAMGVRTVAVHAAADTRAPFVSEADLAVPLEGPTGTQCYLDGTQIVAAAVAAGADAVHPGYGFLSENAAFARAVLDAGLTWVGPAPDVIASMGDKLAAKRFMVAAGVPVLPSAEVQGGDEGDLAASAAAVGFPLLVKAAAGGGGKGMRVVHRPEELVEAVAGARREAQAAFGDATVFLERFLTGSRHVEIQILADGHGNVVHCFERECSIQRRHQKVVEESPSPAVDDDLRDRMGQAAVAAAKAIGYENAGTVEFLLADDGEFYFLEVNTRLQVEHPVTEAVTGLDLVREQILIARGERLSWSQTDLSLNGHAIEVRLYAEDPAAGFLPATGVLHTWAPPAQPPLRFDSGVETGSVVGVEFDPMLAKVVAHAPTRSEAALRLALGLERTRIEGVVTNRDFLVGVLRHPAFLAGDTTTDFIERLDPPRRRALQPDELRWAALAAALASQQENRRRATVLAGFPTGWRNSVMPPQTAVFRHAAEEITVEYRATRHGRFHCRIEEWSGSVEYTPGLGTHDAVLAVDGRTVPLSVSLHGESWWIHGPHGAVQLEAVAPFTPRGDTPVEGGLSAPMPGVVVSTAVEQGDTVTAGQLLVILEAMKMEHRITAPLAGVVTQLHAKTGGQVSAGDVLVVVEPKDEEH